jgi:ankyrin repeat protein
MKTNLLFRDAFDSVDGCFLHLLRDEKPEVQSPPDRPISAMNHVLWATVVLLVVGCATLPKAEQDLFAAVRRDDAPEVQRLAAAGANINVKGDRDHEGLPPLAWAAVWGSNKSAELLLARGANVNWANEDGVTPLHVAAYNLQPAVATMLIRKGAKVDARTVSGGWTPLYKAIVRLAMRPATATPPEQEVAKAVKVAELLLASGADVNAQDVKGFKPIHFAVTTRRTALVRVLIDKGADVNAKSADGVNPLFIAAAGDAVEIAGLLIAGGADVNARTASKYTPLGNAAAHGSSGVAKLLLDHGADLNVIDKEGAMPLNVACRSLLARYTLRAETPGARSELRRHSAVEIARDREELRDSKGEFSIVAVLLIDHGADPNVGRWDLKPLQAAAMVGDKTLAEAAIAHRANIDPAPAPGTESPLLSAIGEGHADVAEMLINKGADVNARTAILHRNSLHALAAHMPDRRLAELLIQRGADVNATDADGRTPLAVAVKEGRDEVAEVLRRHGGH